MPRLTVRMTDEQLEAVRAHGSGDSALGVRKLISAHLGAGQAEPPAPYFSQPKSAKKASRKGVKARKAAAR